MEVVAGRGTPPLTFRVTEKVVTGRGTVGDKNNPSARVSSDGGGSGRQRWLLTEKTPPLAFRAMEGVVAGREVVGDKKHGRQRWWLVTEETPPLVFRATEGVVAGRGGGW
jgi:hypothetical protein